MIEQTIEKAPPQIKFGLRHQGTWTYEDWLQFPNDGWTYEIIDGVLYMSPPPALDHQDTSGSLFSRMYLYALENRLGRVYHAPSGVRLPNQAVPVEPDIFFIKEERMAIRKKQYVEGVPDLVVEILSPSNTAYDRETKFKVYEAAGVPEYWLVDYQVKTVEVFILVEAAFRLHGQYGLGDTVTSAVLAGFDLAVERIFDF
jgi:Uma2 family endonuclease